MPSAAGGGLELLDGLHERVGEPVGQGVGDGWIRVRDVDVDELRAELVRGRGRAHDVLRSDVEVEPLHRERCDRQAVDHLREGERDALQRQRSIVGQLAL